MVCNKEDRSRFMTAWNHVNNHIKDKKSEAFLRLDIVDRYVTSK